MGVRAGSVRAADAARRAAALARETSPSRCSRSVRACVPRSRTWPRAPSSSRSTFCARRRNAPSPTAFLRLRLEPHAGLQVLRRHAEHLLAHVVAVDGVNVQSVEQRGGRRDALLPRESIDRMRPSLNAVVAGLPRVVADRAEHDRDLLRPRQVVDASPAPGRSPAACGPRRHPRGATRAPADSRRAPAIRETASRRCRESSARAKPMDGRGAKSSFSISPQTRLAGKVVERNRPAERRRRRVHREVETAPRTARRAARAGLSSPKVSGSTTFSRRCSRSARGRHTGRNTPRSAESHEIALTVKSRRARRLRDRHVGIAGHDEAAMSPSRFLSRVAAATRPRRRSCRPESFRRPPRRGPKRVEQRPQLVARQARTLRGRRSPSPALAVPSGDPAPSRRRSARGPPESWTAFGDLFLSTRSPCQDAEVTEGTATEPTEGTATEVTETTGSHRATEERSNREEVVVVRSRAPLSPVVSVSSVVDMCSCVL